MLDCLPEAAAASAAAAELPPEAAAAAAAAAEPELEEAAAAAAAAEDLSPEEAAAAAAAALLPAAAAAAAAALLPEEEAAAAAAAASLDAEVAAAAAAAEPEVPAMHMTGVRNANTAMAKPITSDTFCNDCQSLCISCYYAFSAISCQTTVDKQEGEVLPNCLQISVNMCSHSKSRWDGHATAYPALRNYYLKSCPSFHKCTS